MYMGFDTPPSPQQPRSLTFAYLKEICTRFDEKYTLCLEHVAPEDVYAYLIGALKEQNIDYRKFMDEVGIEPPSLMEYNDEEHLI